MMMVWGFKVPDTLATAVLSVNCIVMHMQRRKRHHWQITGQQNDWCNMTLKIFHFPMMQNYYKYSKWTIPIIDDSVTYL